MLHIGAKFFSIKLFTNYKPEMIKKEYELSCNSWYNLMSTLGVLFALILLEVTTLMKNLQRKTIEATNKVNANSTVGDNLRTERKIIKRRTKFFSQKIIKNS